MKTLSGNMIVSEPSSMKEGKWKGAYSKGKRKYLGNL